MSTDFPADPDDATGPALATVAVWLVPVLMWLYYLTALFAPSGTDDPLKIVLLIVPPIVAIAGLALRGRFPLGVALLVGVLLLLSPATIGAAFVIQATVARRIGRPAVVLLSATWLLAAKVLALLVGPLGSPWDTPSTVETTIAVAGLVIATLVGWLASSRAAESRSRADTDKARQDAELGRLDRARLAERERIAREMHDVLAHRLSLVAMHAGVLVYRSDLTAEETHDTAQLIQHNAQQSLDELRGVLSTLRGPDASPEPPQPTLSEVPVLVADTGRGQAVDLQFEVDASAVPKVISRHAYRVVQESLTNARKHAPGAPVLVQVTGRPGDTLRVRVTNPVADLIQSDRTGAGFGLLGVTERAETVGGTVSYGIDDGRFVVDVGLPWEGRS